MFKIYLVGGFIRDKLNNLTVNEKDWILIHDKYYNLSKYRKIGKSFPILLDFYTKEEYSAVKFLNKYNASLYQDTIRRDFIFNSTVLNDKGILKNLFFEETFFYKSINNTSILFSRDFIRILRLARFSVKYEKFNIEKECKITTRHIPKSYSLNKNKQRILSEVMKNFKFININFILNIYKLGQIDILSKELRLICIISSILGFNNKIKQVNKINFMINRLRLLSNNKWLIISYNLFLETRYNYFDYPYKYCKKYEYILKYYKNKFGLSKKLIISTKRMYLYKRIYLILHKIKKKFASHLFSRLEMNKIKIKTLNFIMFSSENAKIENVNLFYNKYILLSYADSITRKNNIDRSVLFNKKKAYYIENLILD